ncbi:MAG: tetratricopeptide repeat protein [Thermodesulfobacteriota bacterium]
MKHAYLTAVVLMLALASMGVPCHAQENVQLFLDGTKAYKNGEYATAADHFSKIVESGIQNADLYYNLGNAYFRTGNIGQAILWYEKARKLAPHDPDLAFNLGYAQSYVEDSQPDDAPVLRDIFFWRYLLSQNTLIWIAAVLNIAFLIALFLRRVLKKQVPGLLLILLFSFFLLFASTASFNFYADHAFAKGVILPGAVSVKSGFSDLSTELFVLHAGSRVDIDKTREGYVRIRFGKDKMGWVKQDAVGVI